LRFPGSDPKLVGEGASQVTLTDTGGGALERIAPFFGRTYDETMSLLLSARHYVANVQPGEPFQTTENRGEGKVAEMQQIAQLSGGREFDGRKLHLGQVFKEIRGYQ
jgi:hypothetical protein